MRAATVYAKSAKLKHYLTRKYHVLEASLAALEALRRDDAVAEANFQPIRFEDCDIIRTTHIAMDIQHGERALVHGASSTVAQ
jgi:hypothetical protein